MSVRTKPGAIGELGPSQKKTAIFGIWVKSRDGRHRISVYSLSAGAGQYKIWMKLPLIRPFIIEKRMRERVVDMNMLQKLKKNKKGFTLVELLVVLVILAILAAAIIPSMMGFIDKAKEESAAAECRSVILAADVHMNELYGTNQLTGATYTFTATDITKVSDIAALPGDIKSVILTKDTDNHYYVSAAQYEASSGKTYNYADADGKSGTWTIAS